MYDVGFIDYIDSNNNDIVMWWKFSITRVTTQLVGQVLLSYHHIGQPAQPGNPSPLSSRTYWHTKFINSNSTPQIELII
jgi:hypothetical protein